MHARTRKPFTVIYLDAIAATEKGKRFKNFSAQCLNFPAKVPAAANVNRNLATDLIGNKQTLCCSFLNYTHILALNIAVPPCNSVSADNGELFRWCVFFCFIRTDTRVTDRLSPIM